MMDKERIFLSAQSAILDAILVQPKVVTEKELASVISAGIVSALDAYDSEENN